MQIPFLFIYQLFSDAVGKGQLDGRMDSQISLQITVLTPRTTRKGIAADHENPPGTDESAL